MVYTVWGVIFIWFIPLCFFFSKSFFTRGFIPWVCGLHVLNKFFVFI